MTHPRPFNWMFIDMNSFFASAEQHLRPELRHRPVGVIPVRSEGTCVIAASVEAKVHGIKTGTRVPDARTRCPGIELVVARPDMYVELHHAIAKSIDRWAPIHKAYSIDEWAIRLTGVEQEPEAARSLARAIQDQIRADHSQFVPCSIGLAPTRLLAKIACELHKPNGLTTITPDELPGKLAHLELHDLCGIGAGMGERLERNGVRTIEQLHSLTRRECVAVWGSVAGAEWWAGFHGHDEPEKPTRRSSMSHANVLDPTLRTPEGARSMLVRLTCRLGKRLRHAECVAAALSVSVKDAEGRRFANGVDLPHVQDTPTLLKALDGLWAQRVHTAARPLKVSVTLSGLAPAASMASPLFESTRRHIRLSQTMDAITQRWGLSSLYVGSIHNCRHHMDDKIAFGRIPQAHVGPN